MLKTAPTVGAVVRYLLLHWHPHLHVLIACGAWTPEGELLELPEFDMERLLVVWQDAVFELYLAEEQACRAFPDPKGDGMRAAVPFEPVAHLIQQNRTEPCFFREIIENI